MIDGIHLILYSKDAERVRAFFRDTLEMNSVDAGGGWLIFALPPGELGMHPADDGDEFRCEMYLMCEDVQATIAALKAKEVVCSEVRDQGWGLVTTIEIPGGGRLGLYQPRHARAVSAG